jgi:hypothetical protein
VELSAQLRSHTKAGSERYRVLLVLFACLAALLVAHDVDHIVHEGPLGELSSAFYVFFGLQVATYIAVIVLLARGRALAPLAAAAVAGLAVIALVGAHLTPFGPLPYADAEPVPISWILLFVPLAFAALTLLSAVQSRGR